MLRWKSHPTGIVLPLEPWKKEYLLALKDGSSLVSYVGVMIAGYGGIGKSSLLHGLKNKRLPEMPCSTLMAECETLKSSRDAQASWASGSSSHWRDVSEEDEYMEMAQLILDIQGNTESVEIGKELNPFVKNMPEQDSRNSDQMSQSESQDSKYKHKNVQDIVDKVMSYTTQPMSRQRKSETWMRVWDCSGQRVFRTILPAFITSRTMFILMFDSRQYLNKQCISCSNYNGKVIQHDEGITTLQLLLQWMATVHSSLSKKSTVDIDYPKDSSDAEEEHDHHGNGKGLFSKFPKILLVGTHGDSETVKQNEAVIRHSITEAYKSKAYSSIVEGCLIVDNTTAGGHGKKEDKNYDIIRRKIHSFGKELEFLTPISWILFRKVLSQLSISKPVLTLSEVQEVASACKIPDKGISSILHFYHSFGVFFYFSHIPSLKEKVITNPQWLVKVIGCLLPLEGFESSVGTQFMWSCLHRYGILLENLCIAVLKEQTFLKPAEIIALLEDFLIIAEIHTSSKQHCFKCKEYFVPSMLQTGTVHQNKSTKCIFSAEPLHLTFSTKYLPPGFFTRFSALLSKNQDCVIIFDEKMCSNKIRYAYGPADHGRDEITISEEFQSVRIDIIRLPPSLRSRSHIIDEPDFEISCLKLLEIFIRSSTEVLKWFPEIYVKMSLQCLSCKTKESHFVELPPSVKPESLLRCQKEEPFYPNEKQHFWISILNRANDYATKEYLDLHQTGLLCQPNTTTSLPKQQHIHKAVSTNLSSVPMQQHLSTNPFESQASTMMWTTTPVTDKNPFNPFDGPRTSDYITPVTDKNPFNPFEVPDTDPSTLFKTQASPNYQNPFEDFTSNRMWTTTPVTEKNPIIPLEDPDPTPNIISYREREDQIKSNNPEKGGGWGKRDTEQSVVSQLSLEDLVEVEEETFDARDQWDDLGLVLRIHIKLLNVIKAENTDVKSRFRRMLQEWLQNGSNRTWKALADAFGNALVSRKDIRDKILNKYCKDCQ